MPQMLVWKPCGIRSSAHPERAGSVSASALPASHCRRVSPCCLLPIIMLPALKLGLSLLLLQTEFADAQGHFLERLCHDFGKFVCRRRDCNRARLLDDAAVIS